MARPPCETCRAVVHLITGAGTVGDAERASEPPPAPRIEPVDDHEIARKLVGYKIAHEKSLADIPAGEEAEFVRGLIEGLQRAIDALRGHGVIVDDPLPPKERKPKAAPPKLSVLDEVTPKTSSTLDKMEGALLAVLASRRGFPTSAAQLGVLSGYSHKTGNFSTALATLRALELIGRGRDIEITEKGVAAAGAFDAMPTKGRALLDFWLAKIDTMEAAILRAVVAAHPKVLSHADLGERAGYSHSTGNWSTAIAKLRKLGLVSRGPVRVNEALVEEPRRG